MIIGRVYGSVVSTHKLEGLVGYKFMLVQCIENKNLVARVFFRNIIYIEQYRRETSVITQKRIFKYNAVLKDLYEEVDSRFYMCHRSYIINFDYVDLMENQSIFMSNGTQITICRANYQRTKKEFVQYLKKE